MFQVITKRCYLSFVNFKENYIDKGSTVSFKLECELITLTSFFLIAKLIIHCNNIIKNFLF